MGASNSKSCNSACSLVSSVILNSAVKQNTTCKSTTTANQTQEVVIDGKAYLDCVSNLASAKGWTASDIKTLCAPLQAGNNTISGISQTAQLDITTTCKLDQAQTQQAQQDVMNAIDQSLKSSTDDAGQFLKSLGVALGGKANDSVSLSTAIKNEMSNTMTVETTNTFINDYAVNQSQIVKITGASKSQIQNVSQTIAIKALADMVAKNSTMNSAVQKADNTVKSQTSASDDILPALWASIQSLLTGWFGTIQNAYIAVAVCVVCAFCMLFGCSAVFLMTGGQNTLQQGISVAGSKF